MRRSSRPPPLSARNGYGRVLGRVLDAVFAAHEGAGSGCLLARVHLTPEDERDLRDAVQAQIGAAGVAAAAERDPEAWRDFLRGHFRVRLDLVPIFGARKTRVG